MGFGSSRYGKLHVSCDHVRSKLTNRTLLSMFIYVMYAIVSRLPYTRIVPPHLLDECGSAGVNRKIVLVSVSVGLHLTGRLGLVSAVTQCISVHWQILGETV